MKVRKIVFSALAVLMLAGAVLGDGVMIVRPIPRPTPRPRPEPMTTVLEVKYHRVKVAISDQSAETFIDQVFHNPTPRQLEGTYIFPLPDDVAVNRFTMYMGGKEVVGTILDKDKARKIYEDIVRRMKDPALLEYMGTRMYKARVFPIPANGDVRITMKYTQLCPVEEGAVLYRYPLNTEKFSAKPLKEVSVTVQLESRIPLKNVYSPSHKVKVIRKDDHTVSVSYEDRDVKPSTDFLLYYALERKDFGLNLITHRPSEAEPGFFLALLSPKRKVDPASIVPKDVVFAIDTSGSMSERDKMKQARNALIYCLRKLRPGDRFSVIPFCHEPEPFHTKLVPASQVNIDDAVRRAGQIEAAGGTNINDTLLLALGLADEEERERPFLVVFLTDGRPTVGETVDVDKILANVKKANTVKARLFVFGVGHNVNTKLLDSLSVQNRGVPTYVEPNEDIEIKVSSFYNKIAFPVLSDLSLDLGVKVTGVYPRELSDLFVGSQLVVLGRYDEFGERAIKLTGKRLGKAWQGVYEGTFPRLNERNEFIPRLWAMRKVGYMLEQIRLHGESKELKDEIVRLSKRYGIMTPYTSFLVMEDIKTGNRPVPAGLREGLGGRRRESERAWGGFRGRTGGGAVRASKAIDKYKRDAGLSPREDEEAALRDERGRRIIKRIAGRTFYRDGDRWVESTYDPKTKTVKVKYFSDEYFELLRKHPELAKAFSLGKEVIAVSGNRAYHVAE